MNLYQMDVIVGGALRPLSIVADEQGYDAGDVVFLRRMIFAHQWVARVPLASIVGEVKVQEFDESPSQHGSVATEATEGRASLDA